MAQTKQAMAGGRAWMVLRDLLLYGWFLVFLLLIIEPHLIYQTRSPAFSFAPEALAAYGRYSGGPVAGLAMLLAQALARDVPGALLLVVEAALVGLLAHRCFSALAGKPVRFLHLLPAILFMLQCGRYDQDLTTGPVLLATLAGVLLFLRAPVRGRAGRLILYLLLTAAEYYAVAGAAGKFGLVVTLAAFSVLCGVGEARRVSAPSGPPKVGKGEGAETPGHPKVGGAVPRIAWALLYLALAAAIGFAGEKWVLKGEAYAWATWRPSSWSLSDGLSVAPLLFLPLAALLLALDPMRAVVWVWGRARRGGKAGAGESGTTGEGLDAAPRRALVSPALLWLLQTAALLWAVGALAGSVTGDKVGWHAAQMDYYVTHRMWDRVLTLAQHTAPEERDDLFNHDVDTALFYTGRLTSDMFAYGPHPAPMLLPIAEVDSWPYLSRLSLMLLRLGRVGEAQHVAYEALHIIGERPDLLQQLAMIHLVKGELPAAELFLNRLCYDVAYRGWAAKMIRLMKRDPSLAGDPEIRQFREVMLLDDDVQDVIKVGGEVGDGARVLPEQMLLDLLKRNPRNRMAFEYLMGLYLLDGQLGRFVKNLHRLDDFGEKQIPPLYEEALLVFLDMGGRLPDLHGRTISADSMNGFRGVKEILRRNGNSPQQAYRELTAKASGTYFYYILYRKGARP